jgi:hypothetical protein
LHFAAAAKNNALAVCQLLLLNGADPNQAGEHRRQQQQQHLQQLPLLRFEGTSALI